MVLVVLGVAQWRRFRVDRVPLLAHIGIAQNAQTFGVGGHEAVLNTVVDHLDEVTGTVRTAVQVTEFGGAADLLARDVPMIVEIGGAALLALSL